MTDHNRTPSQGVESKNELSEFETWRAMWPTRNALRNYATEWKARSTASEKSIDGYWKRVGEMERGGYQLDEVRTASTWRASKYALVHVLSEKIIGAIRDADRADREKRYCDAVNYVKEAETLKKSLDAIRQARVPENLQKAKSKRKLVAKLPMNFADLCFRVASSVELRDAIAAMGVAGFRPGEFDLDHGVTVSRDGENLTLRAIGEKVKGDDQGLEWREVTVRPGSACAQHLFNKAEAGNFTIKVSSSQWLTDHVRTAGRQALGKNDITPYIFRHRFATQAKAERPGDSVSVAICLGHATTKTQSAYGYHGGRSKTFPDKIVDFDGAKDRAAIRVPEPRRKYGKAAEEKPASMSTENSEPN